METWYNSKQGAIVATQLAYKVLPFIKKEKMLQRKYLIQLIPLMKGNMMHFNSCQGMFFKNL